MGRDWKEITLDSPSDKIEIRSNLSNFPIVLMKKKCINYYYAAIYKFLCDVQEEMIVPSNVILYWGRYQGEATIIKGGQL